MKCPVCGARGYQMATSFECSNPLCQNFRAEVLPFPVDEIRELMKFMWKIYGIGEPLDEFVGRFFSEGGRIDPSLDSPSLEHATIVEPDWLQERMKKAA